MSEAVTIAGAFELPPGRFPDIDAMALYRSVFRGALKAWGVRPQDIDGLITHPCGYVSAPDNYVHDKFTSELGLKAAFMETMNLGGATYPAMVNRASMAIQTGRASAVICVGAGKFMKPGAGGGEMMARTISDNSLEVPYGTFIPALYGLSASQFMAERNAKQEDLARVAVSARKWANLNPDARMHREPLTVEDVLASRMIATPFHYYDCSIPSDGGGAVLVTRADLGRKWARQPAYIVGYGECHKRGTVSDPGDLLDTGAVVSGKEAFAKAGMSPGDIQVAQLYDAFSSTPLILSENLGLCGVGEAAAFVRSGGFDPGGALPTNTYGGLMSFGHTGDASGMSLVTAGAMQAMGTAGPVQQAKADRVLVHTYGGMLYDHTTLILSREP
jgi:acetyl-CoA acetyltransferase